MSQAILETSTQVTDSANRAAAQRQRVRLHRSRVIGVQVVLVAVALVVWEFVSGRFIDELMISRPTEFFATFWGWITDGTLVSSAASTFSTAALGLLLGCVTGMIVGVLLGQSKALAEVFEPFITAMYTMPKHALIPLFIMWVGIGPRLGVLTAAVIVFFLVFYNTFFGIKDVRQSLVNSVRVMGGKPTDVLFRVRLPSALIWVVAALKLSVPMSIVGVVVAEMIAGSEGLGHLVALNAGTFNSAGTFAALLALLIAGFLVDRLVNLAVKKPLEWKDAGSAM